MASGNATTNNNTLYYLAIAVGIVALVGTMVQPASGLKCAKVLETGAFGGRLHVRGENSTCETAAGSGYCVRAQFAFVTRWLSLEVSRSVLHGCVPAIFSRDLIYQFWRQNITNTLGWTERILAKFEVQELAFCNNSDFCSTTSTSSSNSNSAASDNN